MEIGHARIALVERRVGALVRLKPDHAQVRRHDAPLALESLRRAHVDEYEWPIACDLG